MVHRKQKREPLAERYRPRIFDDDEYHYDRVLLIQDLNRLLRQHRRWIPRIGAVGFNRTLQRSVLVVVEDTLRHRYVACAVLCRVSYFSLEQLLVRDYCVAKDLGRHHRFVQDELERTIAQHADVPQGFLTNSNARERRSLRASGWREIPTTVMVKDYGKR